MIINASSLKAIFVNLKTTFNNAFDAAPSTWDKIAMLVPSTSGLNDYKWLSTFPRMQKWIGEKAVKSLAASSYTITNDDWEATVEVDRNHIEDDNLGIYKPQAEMAGFSAKQLPDEIVYELVNKGFVNFCYDGQYFFDVDHVVNNQTVSNKGTKKLSCVSFAAAQASYGFARTAMKKLKDDEGRPLNISPNILLVPAALEDIARAILSNDKLEDGKPNPYKGTAELVVDGRLTSDDAWFLLDTTKPVKPFIYQERKKPVFVEQTDPQADDVFMRRKFKFGAEARASGGYGFWQLAFGSDGSVA
ncbi:MAG: Mu-like prophage major head subunit gpT family protein [Proteobacteria bacterium]|nr:Mu-like prophage major head subunit gpT family protein [Pseudomonadota bacterium]